MASPQTELTKASPASRLVDVVRSHARTLGAAGVDSPEADAFSLALHALGLSPVALRTGPTAAVTPERLDRLGRLVARRALRTPLQHLTGEVGFRRLTLVSRPGVFVPRPETEVLTEAAIVHARAALAHPGRWRSRREGGSNPGGRRSRREGGRNPGRAIVLEPCTGSGAVALSVACEVEGARVLAADLDPAAVALARENLSRLRASRALAPGSTCEFLTGDLLGPFPVDLRGEVDVIVANPPYLTPAELAGCPPEVTDHDPPAALLGGDDGHAASDRLLAGAPEWLRAGGTLLLEVAETRAGEVAARALSMGYDDVVVAADLTGRPRLVAARMPGRRPEDGRDDERSRTRSDLSKTATRSSRTATEPGDCLRDGRR